MAVDKEKIERVLSQLPEDLQREVLEFAEALVRNQPRFLTERPPCIRFRRLGQRGFPFR